MDNTQGEQKIRDRMAVMADAASLLLLGGAESFRIEETIEYIGSAIDLPVTCIVTLTSVSISANQIIATKVIKTRLSGFNLQTVDDVNNFSRRLTSHDMNFDEFKIEIQKLKKAVISFKTWEKVMAAGMVSLTPLLVNIASPSAYLAMFLVGAIAYFCFNQINKLSLNTYFSEFIGGLMIGLLAGMMADVFPKLGMHNIIFGAIMPLVPGLAITNALREIVDGQIISGIVRSIDAVFALVALSLGAAAGNFIIKFALGG
ncbi:threonine/serine exporter family protein [Weissella coleopterorum]|uniref:Threonine/serine exporter family protein n=1 Tax=Weissella coleopterorum TaxID=2714949 RepID=A0A6G8AY79_9LACO|nr:threonine/serine exporter family protein [Weissella coleopterorum]QIL50014.1 threonine/serine exporter family protein [Weissella coleopterorum]